MIETNIYIPALFYSDWFCTFAADMAFCDSCYGELLAYRLCQSLGFQNFYSNYEKLFWRLARDERLDWLEAIDTRDERWQDIKGFLKYILSKIIKGWSGYAPLFDILKFNRRLNYEFLFYLVGEVETPVEFLSFWVSKVATIYGKKRIVATRPK